MGNFLNNPLVQLFQGITYFLQVLRHALIFGFILLLYMPNNNLKVIADFKFRGGKCECEVYSGQNGFVFDFIVRRWESESDGLL